MSRIWTLTLVFLAAQSITGRGDEKSGRAAPLPLNVLFLGDRGHHSPADRAAQLIPVLAGRGINVTYTERLGDLNRDYLEHFAALVIYANINDIQPAQEQALLDYVEAGGGLVPLHCASYCFLNSPRYAALVGAQFQRHGMAEFDTRIVDPSHPIMKGFQPFHTWDETYVHHKHNPAGRHVLQVRAEGQSEEPWTWVRTQGKGRVFYTAYGHDARTWQEPGFHDLVERGIRWAAGKGEVFDSRPRVSQGLKPFSYEETTVDVPNYLPGRQWGTQGEPIRRMQEPVAPAESMRHMVVPAGFEVQLYAAEPEIYKPLCMAWDHRGRLFIAESTDYPNTKRRTGVGRDRITICEDTNGDGRADSFKVFAEGLNIPTSMLCASGGLIVLQAPDTLFLKDTNGDDRADERKVLFTGWGISDTHAGPSNLRWGLDNWVWGIVGYSAFAGTVGGERHRFGQGLYRFKPDGSKLEFVRSTSNNSWGVGFSEDGLVFGSTANGCPSVYLPIPNRYYESVRGMSPHALASIAASNRFYPVTDKVRQVDFHGGFTAAAGHALYTARTYPRHYWNQTAFVAEPTGHLVATFTLERKGSDVVDYYGWNLLASDDEWTAPICAEIGPDGNVWVIDWYNYIVQHNPTPHGFQTGRGSAYETPLRDKTHGRIYRVVFKDGRPSRPPALDPDRPETLVAALSNDNQFWRMHAQRLLVEHMKPGATPASDQAIGALIELARDKSVDAIGLNAPAIHALWTLKGIGAFDGANPTDVAKTGALTHSSAGVRRNAVQVMPRDARSSGAILAAGLLHDPDAQVRLETLLCLADSVPAEPVALALADSLRGGLARDDRWLADAATAAAARNDVAFLKAVAIRKEGRNAGPEVLTIAARVAEHWARGGPSDQAGELLAGLSGGQPAITEAILRGMARGWPKDRKVEVDRATEEVLKRLIVELDAAARGQLVRLVGQWGSRALDRAGAEIAASLLAATRDESQSESRRRDAARQLIELRPQDDDLARQLLGLLSPRTSPDLALGLVEAVAASKAPAVGKSLIEALPALAPGTRAVALRTLLGRSDWIPAFVGALEAGQARLSELALDQKQALAAYPNREIAERVKRLLAQGGGLPDPDRQKVIDRLTPELSKGGDPARGKLVFQQQCAKCHRHGNEGGQVGPDLSGTAALPRTELLIHILDPSRSVEGNFVQYTVATVDGRMIAGLLASETRTTVELLDAEAKRHVVVREDIEQMTASKKSLMPEGFEKQVSSRDLNDLLAFLTQQGKYLPLDLRKVATMVSTQGMFYDSSSELERLTFGDWSPKMVEGVPFVLVDPQGSRVPNVILLYGPQGAFPPRMPRSIELPCHATARAVHLLSGVSGWGYPGGRKGSVSLIVRLHYAGGSTEDHPLENGVHFADYIREVNVPGSKLAFKLKGQQQIRYLTVTPQRKEPIERIELIKGPDRTAPLVLAVTVEVAGGQ
ncbi:MAG: PVC-type heme-binding CxxCH protein [Isosphaeraceae bacterium]